ncbi:MAG: carbohydrate kinase family protein [Cyclobacteriaceae bacterium]|nr:carbohydrate kinase family protein [Cyclobacteriaceae bacterium]
MNKGRKGILAAGNWIIDKIKIIDEFPHQDGLANILDEQTNNGGAAYNVLKNLARLGAPFPLFGCGLVGHDDNGKHILDDCRAYGINVDYLATTYDAATSFTDVMTVKYNGRRTFFHQRGANALLSPDHIPLQSSSAKILHLAYMLLLDCLDEFDNKHERTQASYIFEAAKNLGFITSSDVVSEAGNRFATVVKPSLPWIDYLFVNEYEASKITGIAVIFRGQIQVKKLVEAAKELLRLGVRENVVLHYPDGAISVGKNGEVYEQKSLKIPADQIKGAAGAGDAFASGVLYGIHEGWSMDLCLKAGVCTAAASLSDPSCSDGIKPMDEILKMIP